MKEALRIVYGGGVVVDAEEMETTAMIMPTIAALEIALLSDADNILETPNTFRW